MKILSNCVGHRDAVTNGNDVCTTPPVHEEGFQHEQCENVDSNSNNTVTDCEATQRHAATYEDSHNDLAAASNTDELTDHPYCLSAAISSLGDQSLIDTDLINEASLANVLGCSDPNSQFFEQDLPASATFNILMAWGAT